ncbi:hypothetical protein [Flavobacterium humi]|uniref:Uncharacterized protein n=1 Tax=Flavobacterium humi TaxID=2562683 RepID=A0A4Z0L888_9FLAO|nr:hypothetical protein [Flavobacterium humi]TGD58743.1 hypothetical protein E4635_07455 [Flavobacterium humi]
MNLKRIFGAILTLLGIGGLIYAAFLFSGNDGTTNQEIRNIIVYSVLGGLFFASGISLVRNTKDEA